MIPPISQKSINSSPKVRIGKPFVLSKMVNVSNYPTSDTNNIWHFVKSDKFEERIIFQSFP